MNIIPRPFQTQILNQLEETKANRILISAPTGAGKAYLLMMIATKAIANNQSVLILVDRIQLVKQLSKSATTFNLPHNIIQGNNKTLNNHLLTIASIQTYFKSNYPKPDLILIDECHTQYKPLTEYLSNFEGIAIGVTATPYTKGLLNIYPHLIAPVTTETLIDQQILVPIKPELFTPIDMTNAPIIMDEWQATEIEYRSPEIYPELTQTIQNITNKTVLIFGATITQCKQVQNQLRYLDIYSQVYTSKQTKSERENIIKQLEIKQLSILLSVAALSKGFDFPPIDCIIDLRPLRTSLTEYIQMLGRGMRINTNKTHCQLLDFSGNWNRFKEAINLHYTQGSQAVLNHLAQLEIQKQLDKENLLRHKERLKQIQLDHKEAIRQIDLKYQEPKTFKARLKAFFFGY